MASNENKRVVKNAVWLTVFQFANYIIPILIIPYVTRILGVETFGKVTVIQTIANYATILINFSFEYTSTKEVAINKNNPTALRQVFWNTLRIKSIMLGITAAIFIPLTLILSKNSDEIYLYLAAWIINIGWCLYPSWYFQGVEKMGVMSTTNFLIKLTGALLIVICVRSANDGAVYLFTFSLPYILGALATLWYCMKKEGINYEKPDEKGRKELFKKSIPIFVANVFSSITPTLALTMLGYSDVSEAEVGLFSGAYKLIFAALAITNVPISMAVYPKLSREFAQSREAGIAYFRKSLRFVLGISLFVSIATYIAAPLVVQILLGEKFIGSIEILRAYSIAPLLCTTALYLTVQGLYAMDRQNYASVISITTLVICSSLTYIFINLYGAIGAALAYMAAEAIEICVSGSIVRHLNAKETVASSEKQQL